MKAERYGEVMNNGTSQAFPRAGDHIGYDINVSTQLITVIPARTSDYCKASEFSALFSKMKSEAPYASYIDFTRIKHRVFSEENILGMLPEQISTVEISLSNRTYDIDDDGDELLILTYDLPKGLELAQNISVLIIHYPAQFCEIESFEAFTRDLNIAIEALPNLRHVYFTTFSDDEQVENELITRGRILESLSSNIPEYRFYVSNTATDKLMFTRSSASHPFIETPLVRAAAEEPDKKVIYFSLESLEALASLSTFSPKKTRDLSIEVIWKGLLKTVTREYTKVTLHQNSNLIASFPISNASGGLSALTLGAVELLVPDNIEVCIHYLKCSMKAINYMRGVKGLFTESPLYIGDGTYKLSIGSRIEKDGIQQYKLIIDNQTLANSDRVEISVNLEPSDMLSAGVAHKDEKSMP